MTISKSVGGVVSDGSFIMGMWCGGQIPVSRRWLEHAKRVRANTSDPTHTKGGGGWWGCRNQEYDGAVFERQKFSFELK